VFESQWGIDESVVSIVCCQVEVSVTGRSLPQSSPSKRVRVCVCVCVCVCVSDFDKRNNNLMHIQ